MVELHKRLVVGLIMASLLTSSSLAQDQIPLDMIFELARDDDLSIEPKIVEKRCSELLAKREHETAERITLALKHRFIALARMYKQDAAKVDIDELCKMHPKDALFRSYRAALLLELGQPKESMQDAKEAMRLDPNAPESLIALAIGHLGQGDSQAAIDSLSKAIALHSEYAFSYYLRGALSIKEAPELALKDLNRYIEMSPYHRDPATPFTNKGMCLLSLNRPREAMSCFLLARRLSQNQWLGGFGDRVGVANIAEGLARSYGQTGRFHLAAHYAEDFVKLLPTERSYSLCAEYYSKLGKRDEADRAIEKLLTFSKQYPELLCVIGNANFNLGRHAGALEFFDKGLQRLPDHVRCLMAKARFLATCSDAKFRDGAQAVKLARRAYEDKSIRDWEKWQPAMLLGEAHAERGDFSDAVRFAKEALERAGPEFGRRQEFLDRISLFEKKMPYRAKPVDTVR